MTPGIWGHFYFNLFMEADSAAKVFPARPEATPVWSATRTATAVAALVTALRCIRLVYGNRSSRPRA
jgi:hypothetical protein